MVLIPDNRQNRGLISGAVKDDMERILREENLARVELRDNRYALIFHAGDNFSMLNFMSGAIQHANRLRRRLCEAGIDSVSMGISNPGTGTDIIKELYEQAAMAAEMRVVVGLNRNLLYSSVGAKRQVFNRISVDTRIAEIRQLLDERRGECAARISELYNVSLIDGFMEFYYFKYLNMRFYGMVLSCAEKWGISLAQVFGESEISAEEINELETAKDMAEYFCALIKALLKGKDDAPKQGGTITEKAKALIGENLNRDISLNEIADIMHIHKGYLCRVFKEETGENLMQYVISRKVEEAKNMLCQTPLRLYEISDKLGFATPQYFSSVFKRQTGITPNEYKKGL